MLLVLQSLDATVDELPEVLEVKQLSEELLHVGPGLQEPGEGVRACVCVCVCVCV